MDGMMAKYLPRGISVEQALLRAMLDSLLLEIEQHDTDYDRRYTLVLQAVSVANQLGYPAGFRIDPQEPEWPCAFITLPGVGQISWHCPQFPESWDGHTTAEKYQRIATFTGGRAAPLSEVMASLYRNDAADVHTEP